MVAMQQQKAKIHFNPIINPGIGMERFGELWTMEFEEKRRLSKKYC